MKSPDNPSGEFKDGVADHGAASPVKLTSEEVLKDFHAGMRTKGFLNKYGLTMKQFESLLRRLLQKGLLTREEFKLWKEHRLSSTPPQEGAHNGTAQQDSERPVTVETYVIADPEKNHSWALQLFSAKRESIRGAQFKVNLQGKKYLFVVEQLLFRGAVEMLPGAAVGQTPSKQKREEALDFISHHGWAAYLEQRAFAANFDSESSGTSRKARLVLLHCRNQTFLAALHTPAPAINLYVGPSLETIRRRLSKSVDTSVLDI
ncbi:MAG: hypothetical protein WBG50_12315 [Desulfomonilaceae bacterium]